MYGAAACEFWLPRWGKAQVYAIHDFDAGAVLLLSTEQRFRFRGQMQLLGLEIKYEQGTIH